MPRTYFNQGGRLWSWNYTWRGLCWFPIHLPQGRLHWPEGSSIISQEACSQCREHSNVGRRPFLLHSAAILSLSLSPYQTTMTLLWKWIPPKELCEDGNTRILQRPASRDQLTSLKAESKPRHLSPKLSWVIRKKKVNHLLKQLALFCTNYDNPFQCESPFATTCFVLY